MNRNKTIFRQMFYSLNILLSMLIIFILMMFFMYDNVKMKIHQERHKVSTIVEKPLWVQVTSNKSINEPAYSISVPK